MEEGEINQIESEKTLFFTKSLIIVVAWTLNICYLPENTQIKYSSEAK